MLFILLECMPIERVNKFCFVRDYLVIFSTKAADLPFM